MPKPKRPKRAVKFTLLLSETESQKLAKLAASQGMSAATWLRRAILTAIIAAMFLGCGGVAPDEERCEMRVVLANPGPSRGCFTAIAGEGSCVRLPGGECGPFVEVRVGESYEALACADDWGAPTLEPCFSDEVSQ